MKPSQTLCLIRTASGYFDKLLRHLVFFRIHLCPQVSACPLPPPLPSPPHLPLWVSFSRTSMRFCTQHSSNYIYLYSWAAQDNSILDWQGNSTDFRWSVSPFVVFFWRLHIYCSIALDQRIGFKAAQAKVQDPVIKSDEAIKFDLAYSEKFRSYRDVSFFFLYDSAGPYLLEFKANSDGLQKSDLHHDPVFIGKRQCTFVKHYDPESQFRRPTLFVLNEWRNMRNGREREALKNVGRRWVWFLKRPSTAFWRPNMENSTKFKPEKDYQNTVQRQTMLRQKLV